MYSKFEFFTNLVCYIHCILLLSQPENVVVEKPESNMLILKLLHFSRAQEIRQGTSVTVKPHLDDMEFKGIEGNHSMYMYTWKCMTT